MSSSRRQEQGKGPKEEAVTGTSKLTLDDVNPVGLGRRSRQIFDDVWKRLTQLGQLAQPAPREEFDPVLIAGPNCDFTTPNAENTVVLVVGATGRIGRVLLRKLLLRGYTVRVLVRSYNAETLEKLPRSVAVFEGDLGNITTLHGALAGVSKVIFCAGTRSTDPQALALVNHLGVGNLAKAMLDNNNKLAQRRLGRSAKNKLPIVRFGRADSLDGWQLREGHAAPPQDVNSTDAAFEVNEAGSGVFSGFVYSKGSHVEIARRIALPSGQSLDRYEGLVARVAGDGKPYSMLLETSDGGTYFARFTTKEGWSRLRIPFSSFRSAYGDGSPLDPSRIIGLGFRFELRRTTTPGGAARGNGAATRDPYNFRLELEYVKALPGGQETDFILVSCTGAGVLESHREIYLRAKMAAETALRNCGLGYTIVRPGPLREEPGGQRALVFDQGNRITQGISCADVADVCVKALHDPMARNKSFEVCHEYASEAGTGLYELVAHLPDKSNNYLTPALALLEKNT